MEKIIRGFKSGYTPSVQGSGFEPYIGITSDKEAIIEGCKGIIEYSDVCISVNCKKYIVRFDGFSLSIRSFSKECISVTGTITNINFCVV